LIGASLVAPDNRGSQDLVAVVEQNGAVHLARKADAFDS
jgi:hypothetical protein